MPRWYIGTPKSSLEVHFAPPAPLLAGRLVFALDGAPGLAKTAGNFAALCTGERGACKNAPNKRLHYLDCPVHRIVKGFVAQGGDVTRGDGSGGEVSVFVFAFAFGAFCCGCARSVYALCVASVWTVCRQPWSHYEEAIGHILQRNAYCHGLCD